MRQNFNNLPQWLNNQIKTHNFTDVSMTYKLKQLFVTAKK